MRFRDVSAALFFTPLLLLAGCELPTTTSLPTSVTERHAAVVSPASFAQVPPGLAKQDQAVVDAFADGVHPGAVIDTDAGCGLLLGLFNDAGEMVGIGGLFPEACTPGTFLRTDPDGTQDLHAGARGYLFLLLFDPSAYYGSGGSDVHWEMIQQEDGQHVLDLNGTLSDGSLVRAHFVNGPSSGNHGQLWVQGLGYVLGGH